MQRLRAPARMIPQFVQRVWGRADLAQWYQPGPHSGFIGEVWLTGPDCLVATGEAAGLPLTEAYGAEFPLLVKMLFPADKLSVQVHPNDGEARVLGLPRGKTECWYVLEADDGATVACGLKAGVSVADLEAAVRNGSAETVLEMLPVSAGDMVFVDAGTVHAIGPGVTLLEVQQTCDVTYRLYDYGRPRELHLDAGLAVVKERTGAGKVEQTRMDGFTRLVATRYFVVDGFDMFAGESRTLKIMGPACVIGITGYGHVGDVRFAPGECVVMPAQTVQVSTESGCGFICCYQPE